MISSIGLGLGPRAVNFKSWTCLFYFKRRIYDNGWTDTLQHFPTLMLGDDSHPHPSLSFWKMYYCWSWTWTPILYSAYTSTDTSCSILSRFFWFFWFQNPSAEPGERQRKESRCNFRSPAILTPIRQA